MIPSDFLPLLGELLVKSALVLTAAALISRAWSRASAAQRHLVWCAAFCAVLLLPLTKTMSPRWTVPLVRVVVEPMVPPEAWPVQAAATAPAPSVAKPARSWSVDWRKAPAAIWVLGAAGLLAMQLLGTLRRARLRRSSSVLEHARIEALATAAFRDVGVTRRVELRVSPAGCVPLTWGARRPVLLLPAEALDWDEQQLMAALRHEAGHIARGDYLTRRIAHLACALYWPNPLVWFAARQLRTAQEEATDDLVLRAGSAPEEYAAQLLDVAHRLVARRGLSHCVLPMASPSTLERRMLAIVDAHRNRSALNPGAILGSILTVVLALGLSTAAQLRAQENRAAAGSAGGAAPRQILVEAKFLELTPEAKAAVPSSFAPGPQLPETVEGTLMLSGVLTDEQFQPLLRALNQQRGADLLSAPRVITKSGLEAMIEIVREFRYPTEFEKGAAGWQPKNFATRKAGIFFKVEPAAGPDGYTLDLDLQPSVVEFLGWVDEDTGEKHPVRTLPATSPGDALAGLPPGHRGRPVFSERKTHVAVSIFDGQTVILQPFGEPPKNPDFPEESAPRTLMIFVTARMLDETAPGAAAAGSSALDQTAAAHMDDLTFARRLYLDLLGVAPTPDQLNEFFRDTAPDKRDRLTRRLLGQTKTSRTKAKTPAAAVPSPAEPRVRVEEAKAASGYGIYGNLTEEDLERRLGEYKAQLAKAKLTLKENHQYLALLTAKTNLLLEKTAALPKGSGQPASPAGDLFLTAYQAFQKATALENEKKFPAAKAEIRRCLETLGELSKLDPQWNPKVVAYRKTKAEEADQRLRAK